MSSVDGITRLVTNSMVVFVLNGDGMRSVLCWFLFLCFFVGGMYNMFERKLGVCVKICVGCVVITGNDGGEGYG